VFEFFEFVDIREALLVVLQLEFFSEVVDKTEPLEVFDENIALFNLLSVLAWL
jgi:hypothetical protein